MLTRHCAVEQNSFIIQSGFELLTSGPVSEQTDSENRARPRYLHFCQLCDVITVSLLATSVFEVPPGASADCRLLNTVYVHDKLVFTGGQWNVCLHGGRRCVRSMLPRFCVRRWNEWICVVTLTLHVVELNGANPSWCIWSSFKEVESPARWVWWGQLSRNRCHNSTFSMFDSFSPGYCGSKSSQWIIRTVRRINISEEQKWQVNGHFIHFIPQRCFILLGVCQSL